MVFVLGILTLLSLIGIALIAITQSNRVRVSYESDASQVQVSDDGVIRLIRDLLRADLWGYVWLDTDNDGTGDSLVLDDVLLDGTQPRHEFDYDPLIPGQPPANSKFGDLPIDAPGSTNRWLSSLTPHLGTPVDRPTGWQGTFQIENQVLVWPWVSYIGSDMLHTLEYVVTQGLPGIEYSPYVWPGNSRAPAGSPLQLVKYDWEKALAHVPILQTPPPNQSTRSLIPGSTTNIPIADSRRAWIISMGNVSDMDKPLLLAQLAPEFATLPPDQVDLAWNTLRFPYWDTNADGIPDLYDADGDGIPDSPLSMELSLDSSDPNRTRKLYVAVRIVDHSGMSNVNVASSWKNPISPDTMRLTFSEVDMGPLGAAVDHQRRGRRVTEQLLDPLLMRYDLTGFGGSMNGGQSDRAWNLMDQRTRPTAWRNIPWIFDATYVRRAMVGGQPLDAANYFTYGMSDEAALRYRNTLVPYALRNFDKARVEGRGVGYETAMEALRHTLMWSEEVSDATFEYRPDRSRVHRFNSDLTIYMNNNFNDDFLYEGYGDSENPADKGWRALMQEDHPAAIRKHMFTTTSVAVDAPPQIATQGVGETYQAALTRVLSNLRARGMDWPIYESNPLVVNTANFAFPYVETVSTILSAANVPDSLRVLPVDINMNVAGNFSGLAGPQASEAVKWDYIRYIAAAMFLALDDASQYQWLRFAGTAADARRTRLAWQFALNMADYRDRDGQPTRFFYPNLRTGLTEPMIGLEKQPFFTEAYARLEIVDQADDTQDKWFDAVELYIPAPWMINLNEYALRTTLAGGGIGMTYPLVNFLSNNGAGSPAGVVDGNVVPGTVAPVTAWTPPPAGTLGSGRFIVFCGDVGNAPAEVGPTDRFYVNPAFQISEGGSVELVYVGPNPADTTDDYVVDIIGESMDGVNADPPVGTLMAPVSAASGGTAASSGWRRSPNPTDRTSGDEWTQSLLRCTDGWRFTYAWHLYSEKRNGQTTVGGVDIIDPTTGVPILDQNGQPQRVFPDAGLLGAASPTTQVFRNGIPENIWPTRSSFSNDPLFPRELPSPNNDPNYSFVAGKAFESFDSVGEISRILTVGPEYDPGTTRWVPATARLAYLLDRRIRDLPDDPGDRVAAGHVDFADADEVGAGLMKAPWTHRLFRLLTASSPLFDGIDNDGDGRADLAGLLGAGMGADPTEGVDILNRVAGRINPNTAPMSVLRTVPWMSFTPMSPEYRDLVKNGTWVDNPAREFADPQWAGGSPFNANRFYDFPVGLVAWREQRRVPLNVPVPANGGGGRDSGTPTVAVPRGLNVNDPQPPRPLFGLGDVMTALREVDSVGAVIPQLTSMFDIERMNTNDFLPMANHSIHGAGPLPPNVPFDPFSPDFWYRADQNPVSGTEEVYFDYTPVTIPPNSINSETTPYGHIVYTNDSGGVRARDVYLARWANHLTPRSDVFTAYIAFIDERGNYVRRTQVTLDRSVCFSEDPVGVERIPVLPEVLLRTSSTFGDDVQ